MKKLLNMKPTLFLFVFILFYSCNQQTTDTKAEGEKLMQVSRDWSVSAGIPDSIEKTLSYWADDATVILPGGGTFTGKQMIRKMVEDSYKTPGFHISWQPQSAEVSERGDMAYLIEQEQTTMNDTTGKPVTQTGVGISIWRKQKDGSWKNVIDISTPTPNKQQ